MSGAAFRRVLRGPRWYRGAEGGFSRPSVPWRVVGVGGFNHAAERRPQNAGLGHGGGAFVTPPGGGAQNGSVEKMWRREKCETKKEAPPQRERRPARDSSPGCRRLLLFFSPLALYNFATLICSGSRRVHPFLPCPQHPPRSPARIACAAPLLFNRKQWQK